MSCFRLFSNVSRSTSTFRQNAKDVDTGRPSGHFGRGLGAIRALRSAWQALKVFVFQREWTRAFLRVSLRGLPRCALSPGFHLERDVFSQAGKTGPSAHQARNENYRDKFDTTDPQRQVETTDHGRRSRHSFQQHTPLGPLPAVRSPALFAGEHQPRESRLPCLPGLPRRMRLDGNRPITWNKPCAFCCETLVAGTTTWSRKLDGEFYMLMNSPCNFLDQVVVPATSVWQQRAQGLLQVIG